MRTFIGLICICLDIHIFIHMYILFTGLFVWFGLFVSLCLDYMSVSLASSKLVANECLLVRTCRAPSAAPATQKPPAERRRPRNARA